MIRPVHFLIGMLLAAVALPTVSPAADSLQQYEVRSYILGEKGDAEAVSDYLRDALIPALKRQGIGPIGVFKNSEADTSGVSRVIMVIPFDSAEQVATSQSKLQADTQYQSDAKSYLSGGPKDSPYQRISSELLVAMDCWPKLKVADGTLQNDDRVYELRVYESPNERLGHLKVDMFNAGEVPIFLDCKIQPIFIGQMVVGPQTPGLTYLTVYENDAARLEAWKAFQVNPAWNVLKKVEKYQGTVSHIDKYILVPMPYSQM
ncbi:hypothetical protein K227x_48740 [Rubripirellula lacrimiformis]|uniref:NIPSNAP domain-containing protein n=1 Tax=Rubripirellula lacrimiformis TaxID=1930273 RepID=A0A517NH59_9BACT|nr:NIPSNAP family protein [Rubripirellula lacrimiformis]QDT06464.1 hypothetical protein K227x_48740 [Rubripirellula lacrimiformis]